MQEYRRIVVALDGSPFSDLAADAGVALAKALPGATLIGCHVYAAKLHRSRFEEMEPGLPGQYQAPEKLGTLRSTHDDLISSGLKLISDAYIAPLAKKLEGTAVPLSYVTPEGKHYPRLIGVLKDENADLVVLGALGHGRVPESRIGSVAERVLLHGDMTDVLVMREPWGPGPSRPVIAGIDGSKAGFAALVRAMEIARSTGAPVEAVTVFDPFFHTGIFRTIAGALPEEAQKKFNFPAQEQLHDRIIDSGLERLYRGKLEQARIFAESRGFVIGTTILKGKVFPEIVRHAGMRGAGLIVLGRFGSHSEEPALIGSNALNVARLAAGNVLIVAPPGEPLPIPGTGPVPGPDPEDKRAAGPLPWAPEAEELLRKIPPFAQQMARSSVEEKVRGAGGRIVTPDAVRELGRELGMGEKSDRPHGTQARATGEPVAAELVVFRKVKRFAPDFHRHMMGSRILGKVLVKGDRELVYEVDKMVPDGPARVSEKTRIEFR